MNPILLKETYAVTEDGLPGEALIELDTKGRHCQVLIINDGPDPINYFIDVDPEDPFPAFDEDTFSLEIGKSMSHIVEAFENLWAICDSGDTASVRVVIDKLTTHRLGTAV